MRRSRNGKTPVHTYKNGSEVFDEAGIGTARREMVASASGLDSSVSILSTTLAAKFCNIE